MIILILWVFVVGVVFLVSYKLDKIEARLKELENK